MSTLKDGRFFAGLPSECPSELKLDQLVAEELDQSQEEVTRRHVDDCQRCQQRMELRTAGFSGLPPLDVTKTVDALFESQEPGKSWWAGMLESLRRPIVMLPLAAAPIAALLAVFLIRPGDRVLPKGDVKLRAFLARGSEIEEVSSGAKLRAGDRLRFKITTPDRTNVLLISVEDSGKKTAIFPSVGASQSGPALIDESGTLVGAVKLDDYPGDEWIHLVWCPKPFAIAEVDTSKPASPRLPSACHADTFRVRR